MTAADAAPSRACDSGRRGGWPGIERKGVGEGMSVVAVAADELEEKMKEAGGENEMIAKRKLTMLKDKRNSKKRRIREGIEKG